MDKWQFDKLFQCYLISSGKQNNFPAIVFKLLTLYLKCLTIFTNIMNYFLYSLLWVIFLYILELINKLSYHLIKWLIYLLNLIEQYLGLFLVFEIIILYIRVIQ